MTTGVPTKTIAAILGLAAFTLALIAGMAADNPVDDILLRAVISLLGCNFLGLAVGTIGERTVREAIAVHERQVPAAERAMPAGPAAPPVRSPRGASA